MRNLFSTKIDGLIIIKLDIPGKGCGRREGGGWRGNYAVTGTMQSFIQS
jgi:hypothetical protein